MALAILWSVVFLGEKVSGIKLLGAAVVIAGVLLAQWVNVREARLQPAIDDAWQASTPLP